MFGRKQREFEKVRYALGKPMDAAAPVTTRIEPVTGPLADLCQDIRKNPGEYRFRLDRIEHAQFPDELWIMNDGTRIGASAVVRDSDVEHVLATFYRFLEIKTTEAVAKVKAEREKPPHFLVRNQPTGWQDKAADNEYDDGPDLKRWADEELAAQSPQDRAGCAKANSTLSPCLEKSDAIHKGNTGKGGGITIETHTPGGDRPVMRDFLTDPARTVTISIHPNELFLWIDHEGNKHPTDKTRGEANKLIEAKRRAQKAGAE